MAHEVRNRDSESRRARGAAWIGACHLASHVGDSYRKRRTGQIHLGRTNADRRAAPGYDQNVFAQVPNTATPAAVLPPNRTLSYRFVAFEVLQDDFRKVAIKTRLGEPRIYISARIYTPRLHTPRRLLTRIKTICYSRRAPRKGSS